MTDLAESCPIGGVSAEHAADQPLARLGYVRRYNVVTVHYHGQSFTVIRLLEGRGSTDQHVENNPETPDV